MFLSLKFRIKKVLIWKQAENRSAFFNVSNQFNKLSQQIILQPVEAYISDFLGAAETRNQYQEMVQFYKYPLVKKYSNVLREGDCSRSFSCYDRAADVIPGLLSLKEI